MEGRRDILNSAGDSSHHSTQWAHICIDSEMEDVGTLYFEFPWASHNAEYKYNA